MYVQEAFLFTFQLNLCFMEPQITFIIVQASFMSIMVLVLIVRGKKALGIFPDTTEVQIKFCERRVSGGSLSTWKGRWGGSRKVLSVIVTSQELWIKPALIVAGFARTFDSIHRIKLSDIKNLETGDQTITITFIDSSLETKRVLLRLKNPEAFTEALNQNS